MPSRGENIHVHQSRGKSLFSLNLRWPISRKGINGETLALRNTKHWIYSFILRLLMSISNIISGYGCDIKQDIDKTVITYAGNTKTLCILTHEERDFIQILNGTVIKGRPSIQQLIDHTLDPCRGVFRINSMKITVSREIVCIDTGLISLGHLIIDGEELTPHNNTQWKVTLIYWLTVLYTWVYYGIIRRRYPITSFISLIILYKTRHAWTHMIHVSIVAFLLLFTIGNLYT